MPQTKVFHPTVDEVEKLNIGSWAEWSCDPKEFDWQYEKQETAYVVRGHVVVTEDSGDIVEFKAGDMVTFPAGLKCKWKVLERIEKVYTH